MDGECASGRHDLANAFSFAENINLPLANDVGNERMILRHLEELGGPGSSESRVAVTKVDRDGRTPLHWAASSSMSVDVIRALCACGAQVDARDAGGSGWTPLMIAASAGRAETCRQLLYQGADAAAANARGQTSLHYAASKGHLDVAKVLLEDGPGGADVNARDKAKQCPLHRAAATGQDAMIRLLLKPPAPKNGATREKTRVNPQDNLGNTPLHLAMDSGQGSAAVVLIEEGNVDRNRLNQDGVRPEDMPGTNEIEQRKVKAYMQSRLD